MAQYTITHTCGHTQTHHIYGTNAKGQRDNKIAWLSEQVCTECYKAEQQAKRDAINANNAKDNKERGYADLTGTPKQVAWAESIRAKILNCPEMELKPEGRDKNPEFFNKLKAIMDSLHQETSAVFWIDNRNIINQQWLIKQAQNQ